MVLCTVAAPAGCRRRRRPESEPKGGARRLCRAQCRAPTGTETGNGRSAPLTGIGAPAITTSGTRAGHRKDGTHVQGEDHPRHRRGSRGHGVPHPGGRLRDPHAQQGAVDAGRHPDPGRGRQRRVHHHERVADAHRHDRGQRDRGHVQRERFRLDLERRDRRRQEQRERHLQRMLRNDQRQPERLHGERGGEQQPGADGARLERRGVEEPHRRGAPVVAPPPREARPRVAHLDAAPRLLPRPARA